jgi:hypothetical protein
MAIVDIGVALNPGASVVGYSELPGIAAAPVLHATSPAVNIPATPNDSQQTQVALRGVSRAVIIDPQTNTVVFQTLNAHTGDVIEQVPAPALLRQLAYEDAQAMQALIQGKDPNAAMLKIDTTT